MEYIKLSNLNNIHHFDLVEDILYKNSIEYLNFQNFKKNKNGHSLFDDKEPDEDSLFQQQSSLETDKKVVRGENHTPKTVRYVIIGLFNNTIFT